MNHSLTLVWGHGPGLCYTALRPPAVVGPGCDNRHERLQRLVQGLPPLSPRKGKQVPAKAHGAPFRVAYSGPLVSDQLGVWDQLCNIVTHQHGGLKLLPNLCRRSLVFGFWDQQCSNILDHPVVLGDVAAAVAAVVLKGQALKGEALNIASGESVTMEEP